MKSEKVRIVLGYILICLIWGSTWLAIKISVDSFPPMGAAGLRFVSAAILFYIYIKLRKIEIRKDAFAIKIYLILGFFSFVIPFACQYWAEQYIPTGLTSIVFGVLPFFVVLISPILLPKTRIGIYEWIGIIIGFIGLVIIFSENLEINLQNDFLGMLAIVISAMVAAFISVYMKKHGGGLDSVGLNFIPVAIAGPSFIIISLITEKNSVWNFNLNGVLAFLFLALFGTVIAFSIYYWLMKRISVFLISLTTFITPIVAIILGCVVLAEAFTLRDLLGSSLVLIGILFANFKDLINYFTVKRANL